MVIKKILERLRGWSANRAGRAKDEIMCGYAEHIIQICDVALAAHREQRGIR